MTTEIIKYDPQESLTLQKVSEGLFASGLFPNAKNKYGAFAIIQYGRELGIPPMMSLKNINLISGQLACNAQLMLTLAMQHGVTYEVLKETDTGATIRFKRGTMAYDSTFSEADAKAAGLIGKDNWRKHPRDMYFWRAVTKGVRRVCPDAVMGLYTADEISEGAVINVTEVQHEPVKEAKPAPVVESEPDVPDFDKPWEEPEEVRMITEKQQKRLFAVAKEAGWPTIELKQYLAEVHGIMSSKSIPVDRYEKIIEWIESHEGYASKEVEA